MAQLNGCIRFWERVLANNRFSIGFSTIRQMEATIRLLKELEKLREEVKQRPKAKPP